MLVAFCKVDLVPCSPLTSSSKPTPFVLWLKQTKTLKRLLKSLEVKFQFDSSVGMFSGGVKR